MAFNEEDLAFLRRALTNYDCGLLRLLFQCITDDEFERFGQLLGLKSDFTDSQLRELADTAILHGRLTHLQLLAERALKPEPQAWALLAATHDQPEIFSWAIWHLAANWDWDALAAAATGKSREICRLLVTEKFGMIGGRNRQALLTAACRLDWADVYQPLIKVWRDFGYRGVADANAMLDGLLGIAIRHQLPTLEKLLRQEVLDPRLLKRKQAA